MAGAVMQVCGELARVHVPIPPTCYLGTVCEEVDMLCLVPFARVFFFLIGSGSVLLRWVLAFFRRVFYEMVVVHVVSWMVRVGSGVGEPTSSDRRMACSWDRGLSTPG